MNPHLTILHLERREDRLKKLLRQLDKQGITNYTIFPAIDGKEVKRPVKECICKGHKRIIQLAKEQGMENCVLGEDDLTFTHPDSYKYFLSQIKEEADLTFGCIYDGEVRENRVVNGMSGVLTLFNVAAKFFDFFLSMPDDCHLDRELGNTAYKHLYYVTPEICCYQRGGLSDNLGYVMYYDSYLIGKKMFGQD